MHSRTASFIAACLLPFFVGCSDTQPQSENKFQTGAGPFLGHEDITRFAIDDANLHLLPTLLENAYPPIRSGASGLFTDNPLLRGNFESDFPSAKMRAFHGVGKDVDWHHDESLQAIHGLRGSTNGLFESSREACSNHTLFIRNAAIKALTERQAGNREEALYWIGHATHIIQDGFSEAHVQRTGPDGRNISSYCTYGTKLEGVCYHVPLDPRDRVWHEGFHCQLNPLARERDCLSGEALWAVEASAAFLELMGTAEERAELDVQLNSFFDESNGAGKGYFHCAAIGPE